MIETKQLEKLAIDALNDLKAIDVVSLDVHTLTTITDVMIICSGRSSRHAQSLAQNVVTAAKHQHVKHIHMEGEKEGEWIIVDLGDVIVHIMLATARAYYDLEDLWEPVQKNRDRSQR